ncbi:DUF4870 domain-containing protein [Paenibacillus rigui]|uniref:Orotate phosphoribosyltransferase n=1 Tax=Paenibacillus rigui TaxID=554312 RepID=A0A229ULX0_9BACL|nr:DUF4870 domain-containing protein [Paenibacillus rigui]OXM84448.1 hypothetical protein CF651_20445 [Paenibacillus rigui]
MVSNDEKSLALLSHLLSLIAGVFAPLIIWLLKKDESYFIAEHAKESLNFQISIMIYSFAVTLLCFVVIGFVLIPFLAIFVVVVIILATVKASRGEIYRYPLTIRLVK